MRISCRNSSNGAILRRALINLALTGAFPAMGGRLRKRRYRGGGRAVGVSEYKELCGSVRGSFPDIPRTETQKAC
jgi:hypothetical protein